MIPIHKILVPVALSPRCAWAARYASRLAPQFGAELIFLHVANRPSFDELKSFLARQIAVDRYGAVGVEGDPADQIIRFAQEQSCGSSREIGSGRHGQGSYAGDAGKAPHPGLRIIRGSPCPVLSI